MLSVEYVMAHDLSRLRELRLVALSADPEAFGSTHERDRSLPPQWWERWAAASDAGVDERTFVLADGSGGQWLGLALVRRRDDEPTGAVIYSMWVAPQVRGLGGSGLLCAACVTWARQSGLRTVTLNVIRTNALARRAYEAAGFVVTGEMTEATGGRELDVLIMTREV